MASRDRKNSLSDENDNVPQWKKELIVDMKKYARTINSAGGSIKLTCPKALRPQLKNQISKTSETNQKEINRSTSSNQEIIKCNSVCPSNIVSNKINQKHLHDANNTDEIKLISSSIEDENLPKPGLVNNLKKKYLTILEENSVKEKRSVSLENILETTNPFYEDIRGKSISLMRLEIVEEQNDEEYPKSLIVSTAKKFFENKNNKLNNHFIFNETNPFRCQNKPPVSPNKPKIIPKSNKLGQHRNSVAANKKPPVSPIKPKLSTEHFFRKVTVVKPFCTSPL